MKYLKLLVFLTALGALACGESAKGGISVKDVAATGALFQQNCSACHGPKGEGVVGPNFKTGVPMTRSIEQITAQITEGSGVMPAFKDKFSPEQINEMAKYVYKEIQGRQ